MAVVGILVVVAAIGAAVALFRLVARRPVAAGADLLAAVRRRTAVWRWSGIAAGTVIGCAAAISGALGRGLLLAAPIFGLFVLLGVLGGELSVRAPVVQTRKAAVEIRRARDYLPRNLSIAVTAAAGALTALLVATTATGSADDLGRAGRALARQCTSALSQSASAWAGSYYSIPLAVVILFGLAAAVGTLHRVVLRPRPGDPSVLTTADDLLRRRAGYAVTGACGVLVTIPLIGVSLVTAFALLAISCRPTWWTVAAWSLIALAPAWVVLLGWSGLAVVSPPWAVATARSA